MLERLEEAERKARLRDIDNSKILTDDEFRTAAALQAKVQLRGMKLVPEKKTKHKAKFVQLIQQNVMYLQKIKYLTNAEKVFLLDISGYVEFLSNCIVNDISIKAAIPMTQRDIANAIGRSESNISPLVKSLIDKGILARSESGLENNNVRAYTLYVNPNIMFSGDRDSVNPTLKRVFGKIPKELKKLPIRLI